MSRILYFPTKAAAKPTPARASTFDGTGRGVFIAPWTGRNGETIIVAVDRRNHRLAERTVLPGDNAITIGDELWEIVEREDAAPRLTLVL